mmetsp:Transcript_40641/g.97408  ORF Transcript_40641/g.97408 Transcript_40641/m.97408 type:complete len:305 (+) Transcript_40641:423-1337(+)
MCNQVVGSVLARGKCLLPAVEVLSSEQRNCTLLAVRPVVPALLLANRLLPEALLVIVVVAPYLAGPDSLPAQLAARAPLASLPLVAPAVVLALLLGRRLGGEGALMILAGAADNLPGSHGLPAQFTTLAPAKGDPVCLLRSELTVDSERGAESRQLVVLCAPLGLLAHQPTLRLGAHRRVAAVPGASRRVAHILARHVVGALQIAHGPCASRAALRGAAVGAVLCLAGIFGAEDGAMRRLAIDGTLRVVRSRAARLASWLFAIRSAILVAHRLSAIPAAMGEARRLLRLNRLRCSICVRILGQQ